MDRQKTFLRIFGIVLASLSLIFVSQGSAARILEKSVQNREGK